MTNTSVLLTAQHRRGWLRRSDSATPSYLPIVQDLPKLDSRRQTEDTEENGIGIKTRIKTVTPHRTAPHLLSREPAASPCYYWQQGPRRWSYPASPRRWTSRRCCPRRSAASAAGPGYSGAALPLARPALTWKSSGPYRTLRRQRRRPAHTRSSRCLLSTSPRRLDRAPWEEAPCRRPTRGHHALPKWRQRLASKAAHLRMRTSPNRRGRSRQGDGGTWMIPGACHTRGSSVQETASVLSLVAAIQQLSLNIHKYSQ